ncbi:MAG: TonB-dependent receptor [Pseudomonadota bacterium]
MQFRLTPIVLAIAMSNSNQAAAQEKLLTLPQLTVVGKPTNAPVNVPNPAENVTAQQMESYNIVNSEDAIKYLPNIAVRKRYIGDRNSIISVRSTSSRQSARGVVYADGLLLSNFLGSDFGFPPRWSLVSPEEIAKVDVLYGPYSAIYPGNSLGATVLITTKMPEKFEANAKVQAFSQRFELYGTNDTFDGQQITASLGNRHDKLSYLVSFERLDNKSQPLSFATLPQSTTPATGAQVTGAHQDRDQFGVRRVVIGINSEGVDHTIQDQIKTKLTYDFTPALQGAFTAGYWQQDRDSAVTSYLRNASGNPVTSGAVNIGGFLYTIPTAAFAPSNGDDARWLYGLSLKTRHSTGWNYEAIASLFNVTKDITRTSSSAGSGAGTVAFGNGSGWKTLDLKADYKPIKPGHRVTFGYHYDGYKLKNTTYNATNWEAESLSTPNSTFSGKTETQALFIQDAWQLAEAWKLILGTRWERWSAHDGSRGVGNAAPLSYSERSESHFSPKASVEYLLNENWLFHFSVGKAYRFPTVSELFQGRITGNALINNDPNLRPENALSKDLTVERLTDNGKVRFSIYEDEVRNTLFSQLLNPSGTTTVQTIQNVDRVRTRGAEIAYNRENIAVQGVEINASLAYNHAITLENANNPASVGKRFYRIPLWRADLVGIYHQTPALAYMLAARYSGRQYNTLDNSDTNPTTFGGTSNYTVFDAKLTFAPRNDIKLGIGIDNITDRRYYVYHPYPGRTVYGEAKYSF